MSAASPTGSIARLEPGAEAAAFEDVRKAFGDRVILDGLDLVARAGEISVIIGGSGAGKSLTMRLLLGLESYDSGSVRLLGHEISALSPDEHARLMMRVGVLFQFGALFDSMTVLENVGFALRHVQKLPEDDIRRRVRENLLLVGLKDVEHLYPSQLSGGMRKRVALARAIAHHPEILLVDEPTTGLDPIMAVAIDELIIQLRDRLGVTVFAITHDIQAAFKIADRISMLYQGRIIATGTHEEIRACRNEVVEQFISGRAHGPITPP